MNLCNKDILYVLPLLPPIPDYPSVQYGVESYVHPWIPESEDVEDVSKECRYVDSSMELSTGNAAFNPSQDWDYLKGGEGERADHVEDTLVGIHHNDLDAIEEDDEIEEADEEDEGW